jgi:hypothetical protein
MFIILVHIVYQNFLCLLIYQESNQVQFIFGRMCKAVRGYWPCNFRFSTVRMGQSAAKGTDFHKISCLGFLRKFVQTLWIWLIPDTSDRHFTGRPPCNYNVTSLLFFITEAGCFLGDMHWEQSKSWLHKCENRGISVVNISVHNMLKFSIPLLSIIIDW